MLRDLAEVCVCVCVGALRHSQSFRVMSSAVSLLFTFTSQDKFSKRSISIVHILSPDTDNCLFLNQRKGENNCGSTFMIIRRERRLPTRRESHP